MIPLKLPKDEKEMMIEDLQSHLEMDHNLTLGRLAIEQMIDYMLQQLAVPIYNQALDEVRKTVVEKMVSLEEDIYALQKSKSSRR
ncbi:DUF2164 domain-containing protein [Paenibacillus sp. SYP-B3998]|uniref:DUF2164 domain-containing protein n=1 Tax=Paenibacillus sp. SYP-B3998 TaxID=2678564 RepID=A0A6G3ZWV3_9BACL|nr:DUF2164 family protein [Paenibacillus sp. SYP-B3998]NEW06612.1 DUF2164 domain-containing protein [Paenibacillus sp. SYP-B3998]